MKKTYGLLIGLALLLSLPAFSQTTNWVQLTPAFIYLTNDSPHQWDFKSDHLETPFDIGKTYYFDGINTGTFDDEDTLMIVTYDDGGTLHTNILLPDQGIYKLQHTEYRLPNGAFRPFYFYVAVESDRTAQVKRTTRLHHNRVLQLIPRRARNRITVIDFAPSSKGVFKNTN